MFVPLFIKSMGIKNRGRGSPATATEMIEENGMRDWTLRHPI
jgi:hypothetical protein